MQFSTLEIAFFFLCVLPKVTFFFHKALANAFLFSTALLWADLQGIRIVKYGIRHYLKLLLHCI